MKTIDRVMQAIKEQGLKVASVEKELSLSNGYLSTMAKRQGNLGEEVIIKLAKRLDYSIDYLLTGEPTINNKPDTIITLNQQEGDGIPLIPIDAMAGVANGNVSVLELECDRYIIPVFKDADYLIQVRGSSMYPKYNSGDIVACKKIAMIDLFFQWNKVYVLDTIQGALIKRIKKGKDDEHILIVSDNPSYDSFYLHRSMINAVALVIGVIRLE